MFTFRADVHPTWYNCHKSRHCMWHLEAVYIRELLRPTACKNTIDHRHLTFRFLPHSKQMLQINVTLPNGHHELLRVPQSSTVGDLKIAAQQGFGQNFLRLITAKPRALVDLEESLVAAGLEDGDYLSAVILQPQLAATAGAFALWCCGGNTVITWGNADLGGDSSAVQDRLKNVQQIQATESAFAAMLADGSIVTWGDEHSGGDSSGVQDQLKNVQQRTADYLHVVSVGYCFWSWPGWWCESSAGKFDTKSGTKLTTFSLCLVPAVLAFQHWSFCMALRVQSKWPIRVCISWASVWANRSEYIIHNCSLLGRRVGQSNCCSFVFTRGFWAVDMRLEFFAWAYRLGIH